MNKNKRLFIVILILLGIIGCYYFIGFVNKKEKLTQITNVYPKDLLNDGLKSDFKIDLVFSTMAELEEYYYKTITTNTIKCSNSKRIGGPGNGGYDVCFMGKFNLTESNCLTYSFGVGDLWQFDDEIATKYKCIVRTFDPSMTKEPDIYQRPSKVWFYKVGLGGLDTQMSNGWNIKKLSTFLKEFKDNKKIIDILKIDIEYAEWDSLESILKEGLLSNVKQLIFESHTDEVNGQSTTIANYIRYLNVWKLIYESGFRQWQNNWTPVVMTFISKHTNKRRTCCHEHLLMNTKFL